jgi:hypothetical protein
MSFETDSIEKNVRIIQFSGKHGDWAMWSAKFLAHSSLKRYREVLLDRVVPPKHSDELDPSKEDDKKKIAVRIANEYAYANLLLACTESVSFGVVKSARTADLPEGDAATAWKQLKNRFEPKALVEDFEKDMDDKEDPLKLEVMIERLRNKFNRMQFRKKKEDKKDAEHALFSKGGKSRKQFKGRCH